MRVLKFVTFAALTVVWAGSAQAALKFCNETTDVQSVSVGHKPGGEWTSEGWWNVDPASCVTVLSGDLAERYFYYRAEVNGGDFNGENYFFCTSPKVYTIAGNTECQSRGYDSESFREIDVGSGIKDYTLTLVVPAETPAPVTKPAPVPSTSVAPVIPAPTTSDLGLTVCNDTAFVQEVSIAYEADEGWTSEGWWKVNPTECALVIAGELQKRYYYYRAEVNGGPFDGGEYLFCTTPKVYTIVGESDCTARGYDSEAFAEIDTGATAKGFTFRLVAAAPAPLPEKPVSTPPVPVIPVPETPVASTGGMTFCNETEFVQAVSIGYEDTRGWVSEGWWNLDPKGGCAKVLSGALTQQSYYYRAEIDGGPFDGGGFYFCTSPSAYEIIGDGECESRGYDREDFAEFDVGAGVTSFTFTLVSNEVLSPPPSVPPAVAETVVTPTPDATPNAVEGLKICNETDQVQGVSVGYEGPEGWTSEGWWNLKKGACATPVPGELSKRYYYYRAEVDGGPFKGGGFGFCTSPQEYTIVGDTDCESRGYEREDFAEIDTGPTSKSFVFTLTAENVSATSEPELFQETPAAPSDTPGPESENKTPVKPDTPPAVPVVPEVVPAPESTPQPSAPSGKTPRRSGSRDG